MIRKTCGVVALALAISGAAFASGQKLSGSLNKELATTQSMLGGGPEVTFTPASAKQKAILEKLIVPADQVYAGQFKVGWGENAPQYNLLAVQFAKGGASVFLDANRDGEYAASERMDLKKLVRKEEDEKNVDPSTAALDEGVDAYTEVILKLPVAIGQYHYYPVPAMFVYAAPLPGRVMGGPGWDPGFTAVCGSTYASGRVSVDGKAVMVRYPVNLKESKIDPLHGELGVDANLDGNIDPASTSGETQRAKGTPVVFRAGTQFIATTAVDAVTGRIVAEERPASDYTRIDLMTGATLPDFEFKDINGAPHKLSDFRGKYLILDFWGTWCGPCKEAIEHLKTIYPRFKDRGLDVLGMDIENVGTSPEQYAEGVKRVRDYVSKNNIPWMQAAEESIYDLTLNRFQVSTFPTILVLDPAGKIIGVNWQGEELTKRLDKILPPATTNPMLVAASAAGKEASSETGVIRINFPETPAERRPQLLNADKSYRTAKLSLDNVVYDIYLPVREQYSIVNTGDSQFEATCTPIIINPGPAGEPAENQLWLSSWPIRFGDEMYAVTGIDPKGRWIDLRKVSVPQRGLTVGRQAPQFEFATTAGQKVSNATYRGKYLILDVWSHT